MKRCLPNTIYDAIVILKGCVKVIPPSLIPVTLVMDQLLWKSSGMCFRTDPSLEKRYVLASDRSRNVRGSLFFTSQGDGGSAT
ncbi:hypothetical protein TNIN_329231 [Trichonephila inaurata madagascariensis]|uniref:Uncharacterized protein n=1 Tax=Trichonephila inaurata madagascariensis TaxID=2747483 RepID=A0A8X6WSI9_9ARAC|nr:hypothetical protein TNIN_329231 [Trichonephila inaurata madagascariensis]